MMEEKEDPKAEKPSISPLENRRNTRMVMENWRLGPVQPTNVRGANKPYWVDLGRVMQVSEQEARRRRCSNCEYYDNTPAMQEKMEAVPWTTWDDDAGFRGYCTKFSFICHDLRSCQAWEEKEFEAD
jgi:hypothetical protein